MEDLETVRLLGQGGVASVFLCRHRATKQLVGVDWDALPSVSPYDPVADFQDEQPTVAVESQRAEAYASSSSAESIDPEDNAKFFADF
ncbi:hypothetical protein P43SY_003876 [Pythium insidiosum]|uniref:AGC protein kinase n=1 Tax=Pythium insidiosum TaxID=114742 RepID=A0AAD5Q771_PYTIN|nr:hypothetical protein P43SY_003876 [Pythium insidiosum]